MLKTRIIPTLLWKDFGLVKGVAFDSSRRIGTLMPAIKVYNNRDVDELVVLNIGATEDSAEPDYEVIEELAQECAVPLTYGGGINSLDIIQRLLRKGADKVAINSAAYSNPELISMAAGRFGTQCVVASVDAKKHPDGHYVCYSHSGRIATERELVDWARELERLGAGEILLTSIDRDGTMSGYDIDMIRQVADAVNIPVIASGGAGDYQDFYLALSEGRASAVAAASIFHFTEQTPLEAKRYLAERHIPVRTIQGPG